MDPPVLHHEPHPLEGSDVSGTVAVHNHEIRSEADHGAQETGEKKPGMPTHGKECISEASQP